MDNDNIYNEGPQDVWFLSSQQIVPIFVNMVVVDLGQLDTYKGGVDVKNTCIPCILNTKYIQWALPLQYL